MVRSRFTAILLSGIAPFALFATTQAQAADAPAKTPDAAPADAPATGDADDIIVTAQRRSENALTVPIAVSVLKPEALHDFQSS